MISEYTLKILCDKYNISADKIITKNNNILTYGEYKDIDNTLDYLINKLNITTKSIEKCPSILYKNVKVISKNMEFLKKQKISFISIESCLHILSTETNNLIETYNYIEKNYGIGSISKFPSVLSCSKEIIIEVEKLDLNKNWNLAIASAIGFGQTTLKEIQKIINSKEFAEHPELFTSQTLAHAKLEDIQKIINSKEFAEHPELFTSQTLAHAKLEDIQKIIQSNEFKKHPELFTSQTLAHAKLEDIQKIINSKEFKEHPELFTSTTLAHAKLEKIQKIMQSKKFMEYPELFTSETLAHAKLEDITILLNMPYWKDIKYKHLLTSSIVAKAKQMIIRLPILFNLAEQYQIDEFINTSFLLFSPSQNFALINYLKENNLPLIIDNKLNPLFGKQPGVLKRKYGIDIKELISKYHNIENNIGDVKQNAIR